ncbi:uncharacterized protein LOC127107221 [Lathyrus oleraceus]|uniref:Glycine-rich protein n=1 Tax=Pisum sativum TaxID=3888 RepID=A0A9D5A1S9_PEA|nr:uncharacterized protein LOC127107221 [Pisum sativum]KAI5392316.1 hypothetical protein KIW84_076920 [Pisum sativum]
MNFKFLSLLLIIVSAVQVISSEDKNLIQSNEQAHLFNGNSTRLNHKVVSMESNNEHRHGLSVIVRKGGGKGGGGGGKGGRGGSGRGRAVGGGAAAGVLGAGVIGGSSVYHGTHHSNHSATALSAGPQVCVSVFILCLSFWL